MSHNHSPFLHPRQAIKISDKGLRKTVAEMQPFSNTLESLLYRVKYRSPEREEVRAIAPQVVHAGARTLGRAIKRVTEEAEVLVEHPRGGQGGHITPIITVRRITIQLAITICTTCVR